MTEVLPAARCPLPAARCPLHDTDHLGGALFIDRMDAATTKL
jgi:peptide deformylase